MERPTTQVDTEPKEPVDVLKLVMQRRQHAMEKAKAYAEAYDELREAAAGLRGVCLVISGVPYSYADSPIYHDREHFRVTDQQVRVNHVYISDGSSDTEERPALQIHVTLPYARGNGHEPMAFELHDLDSCVVDESPAENYFTGEIYLD